MPRRRIARAVAAALALGTAAGAVWLLLAPAASAAPLAPPIVSSTAVAMGEQVTITGYDCVDPAQPPSNSIRVEVRTSFLVGVLHAWASGTWSTTIPFSPPGGGTYTITATCYLSSGALTYPPVAVTVAGPPAPPRTPQWWEPGGSGPPGQPGPPPRPTTPPTPARTTPDATARSTAPAATSGAPSTATPPVTTAAAPSTATSAPPVAPTPAVGCTDCTRLTDDEPLVAGEALTLRYTGFQPGEQVTLVMHSTPVTLGTFTADANGTVTADVTLPESAEQGAHTLTLSGPVTGDRAVDFSLAAAAEEATVATAPESGTGLALPVGLGAIALVLLGAGIFLVRRRRTAATEPSAQPAATPIAAPIA